MIYQGAQPREPVALDVVVEQDASARMAHDDLDLIAEPRRRQVRERGPQGAEAPAIGIIGKLEVAAAFGGDDPRWLLAQPGAGGQDAEAVGDTVAAAVWRQPLQGKPRLGAEDRRILIGRRVDRKVAGEQGQGQGMQGDQAPDLAALAAAVVQSPGAQVDHARGQVGDVGVVQGAVDPQGDPEAVAGVARVPEGTDFIGGEALLPGKAVVAEVIGGELHQFVADQFPQRVLADPQALQDGVVGEVATRERPADERLYVGNDGVVAGGRPAGEGGGELGEVGRAEVGNHGQRTHGAEHRGQDALVIPDRGGGEPLGATGLHAGIGELQIGTDQFGQRGAAAAGDPGPAGGILLREGLPLRLPAGLDLIQRRALAADEDGLATLPAHPAIPVRGVGAEDAGKRLGDVGAKVKPVGELGNVGPDVARLGHGQGIIGAHKETTRRRGSKGWISDAAGTLGTIVPDGAKGGFTAEITGFSGAMHGRREAGGLLGLRDLQYIDTLGVTNAIVSTYDYSGQTHKAKPQGADVGAKHPTLPLPTPSPRGEQAHSTLTQRGD